jgi:predicted RecA/RadA family phage recombinase
MAKNYIQPGAVIDIVAGSALTSGTAVVVGTLLAIPLADIANTKTGAAQIEGVFELPKLSTAVITAGAALTWDISAAQFIIASPGTGDLIGCAVAIAAAGNGTTTVLAKLLPGNASISA